MKLQDLRTEIETDPKGLGYAGKTPDQVLALLTAKTRTRLRVLGSAELVAWAAANGRLASIKDASTNSAFPGAVRSIALAATMLLERDGTTLDLNLQSRKDLVAGLVQANVLTAADSEDLFASATENISRLEETGIGEMHLGDVLWAMNQLPE